MTSFFANAAASGYKPDEILKFLTKTIPGFDKKLKDALSMGYTADQVFDFFGKTIGKQETTRRAAPVEESKGRLTEQEKQANSERKNRRQSILENTLDPKHLLATAGGAALGFATGGPAGAVSGAIGGSAGYDDLARKYEEKVASGSDISFYDFVKMMMQAASKGAAVGFSASQLGSILSSMTPGQKSPEAPSQQAETGESITPITPEQTQGSITPEQPKEPTVEPVKEKKIEKLYDPKAEAFTSIFQENKPTEEAATKSLERVKKIPGALDSSNVRGAFYNPETKKMRVVFAPKEGSKESSSVYSYENIDLDTFNDMTSGKAKPVTEGENKFGWWSTAKDKSIGAHFSAYIKKNPEKFPYEKVSVDDYSPGEKQISEADRTFLVSDLFGPFEAARKEGRIITKASELKDALPALQDLDLSDISEMMKYCIEKMNEKDKSKGKKPSKKLPTTKKISKQMQKEFFK